MTVGGNEKKPITNASATDEAVVDELDRLSNDGGVAPLIPHRQDNDTKQQISEATQRE
jgi:hypothetical protein